MRTLRTSTYCSISLYSQMVGDFRSGRKYKTTKEKIVLCGDRDITGSHEKRYPRCSCKNSRHQYWFAIKRHKEFKFVWMRHFMQRLKSEPHGASSVAPAGLWVQKPKLQTQIWTLQDGPTVNVWAKILAYISEFGKERVKFVRLIKHEPDWLTAEEDTDSTKITQVI